MTIIMKWSEQWNCEAWTRLFGPKHLIVSEIWCIRIHLNRFSFNDLPQSVRFGNGCWQCTKNETINSPHFFSDQKSWISVSEIRIVIFASQRMFFFLSAFYLWCVNVWWLPRQSILFIHIAHWCCIAFALHNLIIDYQIMLR